MKKIFISLLFLLMLAPIIMAQKSGDLGIMGGVTYYTGDLNPALPFRMSKPAIGIFYRQNINSRISVRAHGLLGNVAGDDAVSKANTQRNLNFESRIYEGGMQLEINFLEYFIGSRMHPISPYIFGGATVFFFKPIGVITNPSARADFSGAAVELQPLHTEGQSSP